jgi:uncharacterized protein YlxP (DUF503 family)
MTRIPIISTQGRRFLFLFIRIYYTKDIMFVGVLTIQLQLPGCKSLKEKRGRLKPLIVRLHREFNISVSELSQLDDWDEATLGCVIISNNHQFSENALQSVIVWVGKNWPDVTLIDDHIEIIN